MDAPTSYDTDDFGRDVLTASRETAVLVDFWAPWCGPCRTVGPVLEALASEEASGAGRWTLRKVNTDEYPDLMQRYGVRGIPAMKLFVDGEVVAETTGALPEYALRRWIESSLPTDSGRRLAEARALLASGDRGGALEALEAAVEAGETGPEAEAAALLLARLSVLDDPARACSLVSGQHAPEAEAVRSTADALAREAFPEGPSRGPYAEAHAALRRGDVDTALARLIEVVGRDRAYDGDGARRLSIALFHALGEDDPTVQRHRPTFNRTLS